MHHDAAGLTSALLGEVLVLHYRETPTLRTVEEVEHRVKEVLATRDRIGILVVIRENQPVPDGATRAGIAELLARYAAHAIAVAQVPRGSGFMAAAIRAVLTSMTLLVRPPYPMRVFAAHQDAIRWLGERGARLVATPATLAATLDGA